MSQSSEQSDVWLQHEWITGHHDLYCYAPTLRSYLPRALALRCVERCTPAKLDSTTGERMRGAMHEPCHVTTSAQVIQVQLT